MRHSMAGSWLRTIVFACLVLGVFARSLAWSDSGLAKQHPVQTQEILQDIVTWDKHSLLIRGKRIMFFSAEFHPFRLPVPSLWPDVFQKVRSMGYTGVSFYVDWALLEGKPGDYSAKGVFDLQPFFDAAAKAGIYLLARPGPYINAEVAGGGFPGWMQRVKGVARSADAHYLNATDLYTFEIGKLIAKAQITNGGPVILLQPENEYTGASPGEKFPDPDYMNAVYAQFRKAGINVPYLSNDAHAAGHNAPGQPAPVDIYGHDGYPAGFDCSNPSKWKEGNLQTKLRTTHLKQSPTTPYAIPEFQGGSFDPWAGPGWEKCIKLTGAPFERVFYKNNYAAGITIFNIYMTFGGTNWGNLGHPFGYTSYDYGAPISEERLVDREKYSEAKLQANFLVVSPQYLDAEPDEKFTTGVYTSSSDLAVTRLNGSDGKNAFFIIRHEPFHLENKQQYKLKLPNLSLQDQIPLFSDNLTLHSRDSKMLPINYAVSNWTLAYTTAEIFTWKSYPSKTVLIVYSDLGDDNELAFLTSKSASTNSPNVKSTAKGDLLVVKWKTTEADQFVEIQNLKVHLVNRASAYQTWVLSIPPAGSENTPYVGTETTSAIIKGGYLIRTVRVEADTIKITGDLNTTTTLEIIGGAPLGVSKVYFNGKLVPSFKQDPQGVVTTTLDLPKADFTLPDLSKGPWKVINTLPEIKSGYDDGKWTKADLGQTYNDKHPSKTPTTLYASDYGYHYGPILYRGTFTANGEEKSLKLVLRTGIAGAALIYLNETYLGSISILEIGNMTFHHNLTQVEKGKSYALTILLDNMGHNENWMVGEDEAKLPVGVLDYELKGHAKEDVKWKIAGTLGAEDYPDRARGPANEGGLYAERQGFHLPKAPLDTFQDSRGPAADGIPASSVSFFVTSFDLSMPAGFDIPIALVVGNNSTGASMPLVKGRPRYRLNFYVNGWHFGKYVHDLGPQTKFPVPEGIWDYAGKNWLAISAWNLEGGKVAVEDIKLVAGATVYSGMEKVKKVVSPAWEKRAGAY